MNKKSREIKEWSYWKTLCRMTCDFFQASKNLSNHSCKTLYRSHVTCKGFFSMTTLWFDYYCYMRMTILCFVNKQKRPFLLFYNILSYCHYSDVINSLLNAFKLIFFSYVTPFSNDYKGLICYCPFWLH